MDLSYEKFIDGLNSAIQKALREILPFPNKGESGYLSETKTVASGAPSTTELIRWGTKESRYYDVLVIQAVAPADGTYVAEVAAEIQFGSEHSDMNSSAVIDAIQGLALRLPGDVGSVRLFNNGSVSVKVSAALSKGVPAGIPRRTVTFTNLDPNAQTSIDCSRFAIEYMLLANYTSPSSIMSQQIAGDGAVLTLEEWRQQNVGVWQPIRAATRTLRLTNNCMTAVSGAVIFRIGI